MISTWTRVPGNNSTGVIRSHGLSGPYHISTIIILTGPLLRMISPRTALSALFSILFCTGYFLSHIFGESVPFTLLILAGLAGLTGGILYTIRCRSNRSFWQKEPFFFAGITLFLSLLARYSSFFLHEWSHATVALLTGVTDKSPLDINYGHGFTFSGCTAVDDGTFYPDLINSGQGVTAGLVAIAGPSMNILLAILSLVLLTREQIRRSYLLGSFFFWAALMNISQLWSYIPQRSVQYQGGDIFYLEWGLNLPHGIISVFGTPLIIMGFILIFVPFFSRFVALTRPALPGLIGLFFLAWFTAFIYYGLVPLYFTLDALENPRMWFGVLDIMIGISIGGWSIRRVCTVFPERL